MQDSTSLDFSVGLAQSSDEKDLQLFLINNFYGESPWHVAFDAYDKPPPHLCLKIFPQSQDFVIKAIDSKGEIIGLAHVQQEYTNSWRDMTKTENQNLADLMEFTTKGAKLEQLAQPATELWILSVKKERRGQGVAQQLAEESVKQARKLGFKTLYICCVSEYSAKLARRLGWREHYRLAYKEYPQLSGKNVHLNPTPPHEHVYYFFTEL